MSDQPAPITLIYFVAPGVYLGGTLHDQWTCKPGHMNEASRCTTVTDRGDRGLVLHYRAGNVRQDVTVYPNMIRQVVREAPPDAPRRTATSAARSKEAMSMVPRDPITVKQITDAKGEPVDNTTDEDSARVAAAEEPTKGTASAPVRLLGSPKP